MRFFTGIRTVVDRNKTLQIKDIITNRMIVLKNLKPIGSGDDRVVYRHPALRDRCIKIARIDFQNDFRPAGFNETLYWLSRAGQTKYFDFNYVDVAYAEALKKRDTPGTFAHIPYCYGYVDTDLGSGVVWDYICNHDGSPCRSLKDYSDNPDLLGDREKQLIWQGLEAFFSWQLNQLIMLREMAYSNTLVQERQDGRFRLYHADAIGCADLFPLAAYSRIVARLRIQSKVGRFRKRMVNWLGDPAGHAEKEKDHPD